MTTEPAAMRPTLSLQWASAMLSAATVEAARMGVNVTVAIVDESGVTKLLSRMDGAPLVSIETATSQAYAAAAIGMPPDDFYSAIESDGAAVASFGSRAGMALIVGGLPVIVSGEVAGAIGVAGSRDRRRGPSDRRSRHRRRQRLTPGRDAVRGNEQTDGMKVFAICSPAEWADMALFARLVPDEGAALRRLRAAGTILEAWSPGRPGAILVPAADDLEAAHDVISGLPLARTGLLAFV